MKTLKIFYLETCPYCINAKRALKELQYSDPAYAEIGIEWIEESREPALADTYDYYRVPSVFCCEKKLYECDPGDSYSDIKRNLEEALKTAGSCSC